jgi:hypothetical protein
MLSSSCQVLSCESCSLFSASICINCQPSFSRDPVFGCISLQGSHRPPIENCFFSQGTSCISCVEGYFLSNHRCEPMCLNDCLCFEPFECLSSYPSSARELYPNSTRPPGISNYTYYSSYNSSLEIVLPVILGTTFIW